MHVHSGHVHKQHMHEKKKGKKKGGGGGEKTLNKYLYEAMCPPCGKCQQMSTMETINMCRVDLST